MRILPLTTSEDKVDRLAIIFCCFVGLCFLSQLTGSIGCMNFLYMQVKIHNWTLIVM